MKNVTGYDMCKLLAGSWGTLAAMTDVTIKVLPKAESEATVIVEGLDDARACAAMAAAMGSSCDVSGAAHLPDHVASYFDGLPKPEAATALRLEGFAPSVKHRKEALAALMKPFGPVAMLDESESRALWQSVRQVKPFAGEAARARPLWRISTAPSKGHEIAAAITPAAQMFYDWAGGLLWVAMPFGDEPDAGSIRAAVKNARRSCHAGARARRGARRGRCVRAAGGEPARVGQAREGKLRPQRRAQSRPHVGGGVRWRTRSPSMTSMRRWTSCAHAIPSCTTSPITWR